MNLMLAWEGKGVSVFACALLLICVFVLLYRVRQPPQHPTRARAPAPEGLVNPKVSAEALATLARLPQYLTRRDGALVNILSGHRISLCPCGEAPAGHLRIRWWEEESLALVSESALVKFVSTQQRAGHWLSAVAPVAGSFGSADGLSAATAASPTAPEGH